MGPGMALKAVAGNRFSLVAFGVAQVAIDVEPLVGLFRGSAVLHGPTHTYLAALLIAGIATLLTPLVGRPMVRGWNRLLRALHLDRHTTPESFSPGAVAAGAFVGSFSHVLLDSFMHTDISPLAPWSDGNDLLGLVSFGKLHEMCILAGLAGLVGWFVGGWFRQRRYEP
jgi:hypothetical protein